MIYGGLIPEHRMAGWLMEHIRRLLEDTGIEAGSTAETMVYFAMIAAASFALSWILRRVILWATRRIVKLRKSSLGEDILRYRTLSRCSHVIPPLVFMCLAPLTFDTGSHVLGLILRLASVYLIITLGIGVNAVFELAFVRYNEHENTRNLPLRGALNIARGVVWGVVAICCMSVLADKSPATLLGGLTAFAAVLMLIFRNSILGFVAGIQMSQNDMLHVGDWIIVPGTDANGTVEDVSLTVVKVRNFDNTMVMVPPYTLVSTSFQNWRWMSESGMRRMDLSFHVDAASVAPVAESDLAGYADEFPELKDFVSRLQQDGATISHDGGHAPVNGTTETNLGLFRAHFCHYLSTSPLINHRSDMMVRVLQPTGLGVPVQIYCFTSTTDWTAYEGIRSAVMERAITDAGKFGLHVYSYSEISLNRE